MFSLIIKKINSMLSFINKKMNWPHSLTSCSLVEIFETKILCIIYLYEVPSQKRFIYKQTCVGIWYTFCIMVQNIYYTRILVQMYDTCTNIEYIPVLFENIFNPFTAELS